MPTEIRCIRPIRSRGGYDGWLSIEHEDVLLNSLEGLEKSVALLKGVMPSAAAD